MPAAKRELNAVLYGVLALLFIISATYRILDIAERVGEVRHGAEYAKEPFDIDLPGWQLQSVEPEAARAGLLAGDTIRAINGQPVRPTGVDLWRPLRNSRAGDRLTVEAIRGPAAPGTPVTASIVLQPARTEPRGMLELMANALVAAVLPIACTLLGFWVAAVRIRDPRAWAMLFVMISVAEFGGATVRLLYGSDTWFRPIAAAYQPLLANIWPTAMLFFAVYFPERLQLDRRYPWIKWVLILPIVVRIIALNPVFEYLATRNPQAALALHDAVEPTGTYFGVSYPGFLVLFFVLMG